MKEAIQDFHTVEILGNEYKIHELTLAEKIKLLAPIEDTLRDIAKNTFFKKTDNKSILFDFNDEVSLADLNIDKILVYFIQQLPEILKLSVPDFNDWENLAESQSREAVKKILQVNDFKGFIANFISLGTAIFQ